MPTRAASRTASRLLPAARPRGSRRRWLIAEREVPNLKQALVTAVEDGESGVRARPRRGLAAALGSAWHAAR